MNSPGQDHRIFLMGSTPAWLCPVPLMYPQRTVGAHSRRQRQMGSTGSVERGRGGRNLEQLQEMLLGRAVRVPVAVLVMEGEGESQLLAMALELGGREAPAVSVKALAVAVAVAVALALAAALALEDGVDEGLPPGAKEGVGPALGLRCEVRVGEGVEGRLPPVVGEGTELTVGGGVSRGVKLGVQVS